jgi:hypothetical protein
MPQIAETARALLVALGGGRRAHGRPSRPLYPGAMATTPTPEGTPQRLAAIRAQMSLLADYL